MSSQIVALPVIRSAGRVCTHAQLGSRARSAAAGLAGLGVGANDAVLLLLRNDFAFFEAQMAANMLDAYAVPANWHASAEEANYIIADSGAKAIVVHSDILRRLGRLASNVPVLVAPTPSEIAAAYDLPVGDGVPAADGDLWEDLAGTGLMPDHVSTTFRQAMVYTSGTTGKPKGIRRAALSDSDTAEMLANSLRGYGLAGDAPMRVLINGPMYHTAPNSYAQIALRKGADIILQPRFDAEELLQLIERHRITHMHIVPIMMHRLLRLPDAVRTRYDLSSLVDVVHGAAPCPPAVKRAMIDWLGPVISEYYGSSETGLMTRLTSEEALRKPGSVGRPLPAVQMRIYDEAGEAAPGEPGDIYVLSKQVQAFTYHGAPEKRRSAERDGFVTVGDIGLLDEDGFLFLRDRRNDMIISGGVNIYPAEIEAALLTIPGIRDSAVFGAPDEEFGERVVAHIEREAGASISETDIRAALAQQLARFKLPKLIVFEDALPREDSGKVFKRRIRDLYWADAKRSI